MNSAEQIVADAERWFNTRNLEAILSCYTKDAEVEILADGISTVGVGPDQIRRIWQLVFGTFPRFTVTKKLISADPEGAIVNEWQGQMDGTGCARGFDLFWLDAAGAIARHQVLSFGRVVEYGAAASRVRFALLYPRHVLRALRVEHQLGAR
ncbi:nuclear transport factor 2 family protein [Pendulispora rubella]|uniref:Nuclear transport factor 2 family protein n=1 Tax=Pendulispora rubella TaxID=2741070 RepID=A0ABZ2LCB9_9BACT